jgi:hypothetical protein
MTERFKYELSTGLVSANFNKKFASDRAAWNFLAKQLNMRYKSGRHVAAILYKYVPTKTPFIHAAEHKKCFPEDEKESPLDEDRTIRVPVLSGYTCLDFDGNKWPPVVIRENANLVRLDAARVAITKWSDAQNIDIRKLLGMGEHDSIDRLTLGQLKGKVGESVYQTLLWELDGNDVKVVA